MRGMRRRRTDMDPRSVDVHVREAPCFGGWAAGMIGVGLFLGVMIFASVVLWLYLLELGDGAGQFLDIAVKANLFMVLINLGRMVFTGYPDELLQNTSIIFFLSTALHTACFCIFRIQVLIRPESGSMMVYQMSQFIVYILMAVMLSLLPSVVMGIVMKIIACLFPE